MNNAHIKQEKENTTYKQKSVQIPTYYQPPTHYQVTRNSAYIRPILFLDIDDVVLDTHSAILHILNTKFDLSQEEALTLSDIREWGFDTVLNKLNHYIKTSPDRKHICDRQNIQLPLTIEYIINLFDSNLFWKIVNIKSDFRFIFEDIRSKYHIVFITQGTSTNIQQKIDYLEDNLNIELINRQDDDFVDFIGISYTENKNNAIEEYLLKVYRMLSQKQLDVKMPFLAQIDDKYDNLDTICDLKILLKNHRDTKYNQTYGDREDLYIANDLLEIEEILTFYSTYNFTDLEETFPKRKTLITYIKHLINKDR